MSESAAMLTQAKVRRRPRDRRQQILRHASELIASNGFHTVRMNDIADGLGITARALYRHFQSKQDLLSHVILEDQNRLLAVLDDEQPTAPTPTLECLLGRMIEASLESLRLGALWQREARHLGAADFAGVRQGTRRIGGAIAAAIRTADPSIPDFHAEIRAWAVVSVITSPGHYDPTLSRHKLAPLLLAASTALISASAREHPATGDKPPEKALTRSPSSRRELLLATAAQAFRERGYGSVSLDEFGIVGPAVYRYFDGKHAILETLITRLQNWIALEDSRALREAGEDTDVITELVRGYVRIAFEATDLLAVSVTEALHLDDQAGERERRVRTDNIAEWVRWLRIARPDLSDPAAHTLVHAARTLINDIARIPRLAHHPGARCELEGCALAVLLATEPC